jgi:Ca-activated chloride channel family protein
LAEDIMTRWNLVFALGAFVFLLARPPAPAYAAGSISLSGSDTPVDIVDHHVEVVIDNGFARVEVSQTFHNANDHSVEAMYEFPLPRTASLSELSISAGEQSLHGEVVQRDRAEDLYDAAQQSGQQAGLATQVGYQRFEFRIASVPADGDVTIVFVYYQAVVIDEGVGRFLYPLQEGGTDEAADAFWTRNAQVQKQFSAHIVLKSAVPTDGVRMPDFADATIAQNGPGVWEATLDHSMATLDHDLVFYYRLQDGLPGRLEVIPYRASKESQGTFMLLLTPGVDLAPLPSGADYVFALDISSSMEGKLQTLTEAIDKFLATLGEGDRFRIVTFSDGATELTSGWVDAAGDAAGAARDQVKALQTQGGTNVYAGLSTALDLTDGERASSVVLVTDGVANEGIVDPKAFDALVRERDVRVFGMLLGNSANWPLMQLVADVSGGEYGAVSNADDVFAQAMLIKSKMTHEAIHDVALKVTGVEPSDLTDTPRKIFFGQQLALFGHYDAAGTATLALDATITGKKHGYTATFELPEVATENPELERLWAIEAVERLTYRSTSGLGDATEAAQSIADIGVKYQIVTEETSMVVLSDEAFAENGVERNNADRTAREHAAQAVKMQSDPTDYGVSGVDPWASSAPSGASSGGSSSGGGGLFDSSGGGALGPADAAWLSVLVLMLAALGLRSRRRVGDAL